VPTPDSEEDETPEVDGQPQNTDDVFRRLRELIILGQLPAGAPVTERRVAERLQVSRTPVRSALQRLMQEGFVAAIGAENDRRLIVAPMTKEDGGELWLMTAHLEGMAARKAAQLPASTRKALATRMRALNKELATALKSGVYATLPYDLDLEFHRSFVRASSGPRLFKLHDSIKLQIERYARAYFGVLITGLSNSVAEHDALVKAIAAGEPADAQHAVEVNWYNAAERLMRTIDQQGEKGTW
jgi:DNA-binding GntR family transcriptional regulator